MRVQGRPSARGSGSIPGNILMAVPHSADAELCWLIISMAILSFPPGRPRTPAFARDVLEVGAAGLGALNSAAGAGALVGAVLAAMLGSYRGRGLALMLSAAGFGLLLVGFGLSTSFTLSLVLAGGIGLLSAFSGINTNTMMQTHADPRMRGR
jgi:MFS family permease